MERPAGTDARREPIDKLAWIEIRDRRILSTRSHGKDVWYIPGGKREPGETDAAALIREVGEELSVELVPESISHFGDFEAQADGHPEGVRVRMQCYRARCVGELRPAAEIAEFAWLTSAEASRISPVDQLIFRQLVEDDEID